MIVTTLPARFAPVPATMTGCGAKLEETASAGAAGHKAGCGVGGSAAGSIRSGNIVRSGDSSTAADCVWSSLRISKFCRRNLGDRDSGDGTLKLGLPTLAIVTVSPAGNWNCWVVVMVTVPAQTLSAIRGGDRKRRLRER